MYIRLLAFIAIFLLTACGASTPALVEEMDIIYKTCIKLEKDKKHDDKEKVCNEIVTEHVKKYLNDTAEVTAVGHLVSLGFQVYKYDESGISAINDRKFIKYKDEPHKKSALSTLRSHHGDYYYYATLQYKFGLMSHHEARIILEISKQEISNIRAYIFFHSI